MTPFRAYFPRKRQKNQEGKKSPDSTNGDFPEFGIAKLARGQEPRGIEPGPKKPVSRISIPFITKTGSYIGIAYYCVLHKTEGQWREGR